MNLTQLLIQLGSQLGSALIERFAKGVGEPKQDTSANPVDVAIATKSAVSADREGKLASARGKCAHTNVTLRRAGSGFLKNCQDCGLNAWGLTSKDANEMWETMNRSRDATERTMDERIKELRERIVSIAKTQEGKSDPDVYWREVLPSGDKPPYPKSWCGAGYMWCLHQAHDGLKVLDWKRGFGITSAFQVAKLPFPMTKDPRPGDMAYFTKNQHHAVVEDIAGGLVRLVNFNGNGGKVTRNQVSFTAVAAFYSIGPALIAVAGMAETDEA
jgi:hypothetical protein